MLDLDLIAECEWQSDLAEARAEGEALGEARGEARGEAKTAVSQGIQCIKNMLAAGINFEQAVDFSAVATQYVPDVLKAFPNYAKTYKTHSTEKSGLVPDN